MKVVFATIKKRRKDEKTLRADYSEMVRRRQKRFLASDPQRSNLDFEKKIFWVFASMCPQKSTFSEKQLITAD